MTDTTGAAVPAARVVLSGGEGAGEIVTDDEGLFVLDRLPCGAVRLTIQSDGFAEETSLLSLDVPGYREVRVELRPAPLHEAVSVRAPEISSSRFDASASVTTVTASALLESAALTLDDRLRETPGFSLFRRTSSRVANPTTQGATLRGLAASGASRAVVLVDGVPVNDGFGGWVAWNRVPQVAVERVDVRRGSAGDVYGHDAVGGVVDIVTLDASRPRARASVEAGSAGTVRASVFAGASHGPLRGWLAAERFRTDGYIPVATDERGPIDSAASSSYSTLLAAVGVSGATSRGELRTGFFDENRGNGTPRQVNDTNAWQVAGRAAGTAAGGWWSARVAGGEQRYDQTFSAVSSDRTAETLTRAQRVPSSVLDASADWARSGGRGRLLVGADLRGVRATSHETILTGAGGEAPPAGGRDRRTSAFVQGAAVVDGSLTLVGGVRVVRWSTVPVGVLERARAQTDVVPRFAVVWSRSRTLTLRASVARGFRAPTLNELHRGFRVGNTVTQPNASLVPERLVALEAGAAGASGSLTWRATAFGNFLSDAITNVTLSSSQALIVRQRRNAGRVEALGVEIEGAWRASSAVEITGSLTGTSSVFRSGDPLIDGRRVPQVPTVQGALGVRLSTPRAGVLGLTIRASGAQYDDDRNEFELGPFAVVDVFAVQPLVRQLQAFLAVENVADVDYDVGRTPVRTVGTPRSVRAGLRLFWP